MAQQAWIQSDGRAWVCGSPQTNAVASEWKEADRLGPKPHDRVLVANPTPFPGEGV